MPQSVFGAVFISEIAWMGTEISANDEWIELAEDGGEQVDLTGWTLTASDGSPAVTLNGSISPYGYFLLERTDDESVSGVVADQIFSGALGNTGEDLILKDASGVTIDRVNMSDGWQGGDNVTKDTMQKVGSGWTTAPGTPKAKNIQGISSGTGDMSGSSGTSYASGTSVSTESKKLKRDVALYAGENKHVLTGQRVQFVAEMTRDNKYMVEGIDFKWNFGDGTIGTGQKTSHMYLFPGTYTVVLSTIHEDVTYTARTTVYVSTPQIFVTDSGFGFLTIGNASSEEANLAGWFIEHEDGTYYIPEDTIVLPHATLTLRHPFDSGDVKLVQSGREFMEIQGEVKHIDEYEQVVTELAEKLSVIEVGLTTLNNAEYESSVNLYAMSEQTEHSKSDENIFLGEIEEDKGQVSHNTVEETRILYDASQQSESGWFNKIAGFLKSMFIRD